MFRNRKKALLLFAHMVTIPGMVYYFQGQLDELTHGKYVTLDMASSAFNPWWLSHGAQW